MSRRPRAVRVLCRLLPVLALLLVCACYAAALLLMRHIGIRLE